MKKFLSIIKSADFRLHLFVCFIIAVAVSTIVAHTSVGNPLPAILAGFFSAIFAGIGKEYGDSRAEGNTWSWPDIFADFIGAAVGSMIGFVALLI